MKEKIDWDREKTGDFTTGVSEMVDHLVDRTAKMKPLCSKHATKPCRQRAYGYISMPPYYFVSQANALGLADVVFV